ncbi:MAG TPA: hypothetical protein VF483_01675, partial [Gemmatimonadaceae bacterium]
ENLLGGYYKRWHSGLYQGLGNVHGMANMMSFQTYSSLANNCLNARTQFTGYSNGNQPGNVCAGEQSSTYFTMGETNRVASSILKQLNDPTFTLGSTAQNARARAFAEFLNGVSIGYVAMLYDSGSVVTAAQQGDDAGGLIDYKSMLDSSQAAFQRALDAANDGTVTGGNGFPLPATWIPSPTSFTAANFVKLIRSYRARITIGTARTPADRAAPCVFAAGARTCAAGNWAFVVADAQNGITADHLNTTSTVSGPFYSWVSQNEAFSTWHQMPAFIMGMADGTNGNYDAWVKTDIGSRSTPFHMVTPDLRFPQGATRANQQADFAISSCAGAAQTCKRYFVNRASGGDQFVGAGWGFSEYDFVRFHSWNTAGASGQARNGDFPFFTLAENNMIQAEGLFRLGGAANINAAATLVNATRTVNGLAPMLLDGTGLTPAADCIPRVPNGSGTSATLSCGTLFEAIKYEKRVETAYTHFAAWFFDSRGWGDLAKDTPLYWATPYQDLQARGKALAQIYGTGPASNPQNAAGSAQATVGTYGY